MTANQSNRKSKVTARKQELPAAPKGNTRAVKHGIHAQVSEQRAQTMMQHLAAVLPVKDDADSVALHALAVTAIRYQEAEAEVNKRGTFDRRGKVTSAARWERRLSNALMRQLASFGGTPSSRSKLGLRTLQAADLAMVLSEPDEAKRAELMQQAGLGPGTGVGPLS